MTSTAVPTGSTVHRPAAEPARPSSALRARRAFIVASPVLAGLLCILGTLADPAAGITGREMSEIYARSPEALQWKSTGFHWAYAFWIAPALMLAPYVRGRGAWLANVAALLGFAGMVTLPGMLLSDWFDSAVGQLYGVDASIAVMDHISDTMWGLRGFLVAGMGGLLLALPLASIALWRAGLVRWWAIVAVVAGFVAFMASTAMWWGCVLTTVCFAAFAVELARATRPPR
jgi:hypothetical protein